jgi:hypothetical protein
MNANLLLILMLLSTPAWAQQDGRYLQTNKVFYETPLEQDVLRVHLALGYCTVLQFPEKPILVTVGDNSLVQVEIPKNSKSVVIKPLQGAGETNIFIFTPNYRFNYDALIGDPEKVDYVVDSKVFGQIDSKSKHHLTVDGLIRMARGYDFFQRHNAINTQEFIQKKLSGQCAFENFNVSLIEAFANKDPNYLVLHILVNNSNSDQILNLEEQNSNILVNGRKFIPQYVLFDRDELYPDKNTDGWLVLENSFISLDNKFSLSFGVGDDTYVCK